MTASSAIVEIESVEHLPIDDTLLWGGRLECPQAGGTSEAYAIDLSGWALGRRSPVLAVEIFHGNKRLWRAPVHVPRADVAAAFPQAEQAGQCGFEASVGTVILPQQFELLVQPVLKDETKAPLAWVRGRRRTLSISYKPKLQPLLVTTLGRSGSTWVVRVFGEHPQISAYRPFQYEPRIASYWLEILKAVTEPGSFDQALAGQLYDDEWWLGSRRTGPSPVRDHDPRIQQWVGVRNVEALAAFCLERIDSFYREVAEVQDKPESVYFVEKSWPGDFVPKIVPEFYRGGRELFLVRDFRDMVCSILAFDKRRGYTSFGHRAGEPDVEFIRRWRATAVSTLTNWRQRAGQAHLLRYEDLIQQPQRNLHAALEYLGLDASETTIRETLERAHGVSPQMQELHGTSKDPATSIGRWRQDLSEELQAECATAFNDVLEQFGYDQS